jgi:hypothetical protein
LVFICWSRRVPFRFAVLDVRASPRDKFSDFTAEQVPVHRRNFVGRSEKSHKVPQ